MSIPLYQLNRTEYNFNMKIGSDADSIISIVIFNNSHCRYALKCAYYVCLFECQIGKSNRVECIVTVLICR